MPKKNPSDGAAVGGILFILSLERHEAFWLFAFVKIAFLQFFAIGIDNQQFAFCIFFLPLDLCIEFFGLLIALEVRPCCEERGDLCRAARLQGFELREDLAKRSVSPCALAAASRSACRAPRGRVD